MMILKYKIKVVYHSQNPHNVGGAESTCAAQFSDQTYMYVAVMLKILNLLGGCKYKIYSMAVALAIILSSENQNWQNRVGKQEIIHPNLVYMIINVHVCKVTDINIEIG